MKISMLKKWHVRGVISSLSILLQISLLLFFAGLIQFLLSLEVNAVTIPVTILIVLSTLFPVITTVLPALHVYAWQKETTIDSEGEVPVPCPYKSPQAELFYILSIALSRYRPFPQLFSLFYALFTFIPTALVTGTVIAKIYLHRVFSEGKRANHGRKVLAVLIDKPIFLLFSTLEGLSAATDNVLHYLHEIRINIRGSIPIHYNRTMSLFRPAMEHESEQWWAFDVAWVSIRRDYAFRLYASREWSGKFDAHRSQIIQEWESGEHDSRAAWGKVNSREANARAGPPWDQLQGLILLRHQYQHNDSDTSIMEAALRCFKSCVSPFRAYDESSDSLAEINTWMIGFEDATTEILRPHVKEEVTFSNLARYINESPGRGLGFELCTASFYHEAIFHFLGNFHLEKLTDKGEVRLKTAWVEIYYKLVRCLPSSEELQHIDVPFAFATCSRDVSSVTPQFSEEEDTGKMISGRRGLFSELTSLSLALQEIYLEKAKACAERLDKYRAEGSIASDGLRNQVLHDFFFAIGAPPFYARKDIDKIPADIQKLVSSLSQFCQYVKQRHNPNVVDLADRIETALGDTVDNYLEDSQIAFSRVAELTPDGTTGIQEMEPLVSGEDAMPSPGPSHFSKGLVEEEYLVNEPLVSGEDIMAPGPSRSSDDLVEQESKDARVSGEDVMSPGSPSSNNMAEETIDTRVPDEAVIPLERPRYTFNDDPWEGRTDLW
ncbi:hypothetical protein M413DRAFT_128612 [Hebeloma cylindrosporum]|uniref:DUF6535 domain-containing protein n=1 Tax=Hebeloma cylindrosporum TaxID=76867 RepID=A0A0C3CD69_HEBCY|nr:hypothetical protein M413DRAFT_128612 [Hebeloma cylindrosporum h7]